MTTPNSDDFVMDYPMADSGAYQTLLEYMAHPPENAHRPEEAIRSRLLHNTAFNFEDLTVRRTPTGFCLEGAVQCTDEDYARLVENVYEMTGAEVILNRVIHLCSPCKPKG